MFKEIHKHSTLFYYLLPDFRHLEVKPTSAFTLRVPPGAFLWWSSRKNTGIVSVQCLGFESWPPHVLAARSWENEPPCSGFLVFKQGCSYINSFIPYDSRFQSGARDLICFLKRRVPPFPNRKLITSPCYLTLWFLPENELVHSALHIRGFHIPDSES